jgi:hypothetical protein
MCGHIKGELRAIEPAEGAIIAVFGCHCSQCGAPTIERVALPSECLPELEGLIGLRSGIMRSGENYIFRDFSEAKQ